MAGRRRVEGEPGYVLHTYAWKETSLVVEALTRHHGRTALLARGARRPRSATRGMLLAFHPLRLSWSGSGDLVNLTGVEWDGGPGALAGLGLMCGFYLNELLLRLLARDDAHERLFDAYGDAVAALAGAGDPEPVLRGFERRLLAELGYAPLLEREADGGERIDASTRYLYLSERGPVRASGLEDAAALLVSGRTLLCMAGDDYGDAVVRDEARRLMRVLIAERLNGATLHSRSVLKELRDL